MRARTVTDVILGEAVRGTPEERYRDMLAIASVMVNRANMLGVSLEDVVQNTNEFNAYNRSLPAGVNAYRDLAERALTEVLNEGPVNNATFYATPAAADNLPNGLSFVDQTTGHMYFNDPLNRAIGTAVGYRQPNAQAYQQMAAIDENNLPTPSPAPRGILDAPQTQTAGILGPSAFDAERFGAPAPSFDTARFGEPTAPSPSFDTARFGEPQAVAENFDVGRFGSMSPMNVDAMASAAGIAPEQPTQVAGSFDAGRFGTMTDQPQGIAGLRDALTAQQAQMTAPQGMGLLGEAQAAQPAAPATAGLAEQYGQYGAGQLAMRDAMAPGLAAANLAADVADQRGLLSSVKTDRLAAAPAVQPGYVDPVVTAQPAYTQPTYTQPAPQPAPQIAPAAPAAPARPAVEPKGTVGGTPTGAALGALVERQMNTRSLLGGIGGGLLGGALLGPVGAALGGLLGRNVANRTYHPPAPEAPKGGTRGSDYGDLNERGRETYGSSEQFRDAVDSGVGGLW